MEGVTPSNMARPPSEHSWTPDWDWLQSPRLSDAKLKTVDVVWRGFKTALTRTMTLRTRGNGRQGHENHVATQEQESGISRGRRWHVQYFHILLCELVIYLEQTRQDCGKTNQERFFFLVFFIYEEWSVFYEFTWFTLSLSWFSQRDHEYSCC